MQRFCKAWYTSTKPKLRINWGSYICLKSHGESNHGNMSIYSKAIPVSWCTFTSEDLVKIKLSVVESPLRVMKEVRTKILFLLVKTLLFLW